MGLNLLEHIYQALNRLGAVKTRQEFCRYWLGRGEGYMRTLRFTSLEPSVDVISVLRSRIRYYASHYKTETDSKAEPIAENYRRLAVECEEFIERRSKRIWEHRVLEAV